MCKLSLWMTILFWKCQKEFLQLAFWITDKVSNSLGQLQTSYGFNCILENLYLLLLSYFEIYSSLVNLCLNHFDALAFLPWGLPCWTDGLVGDVVWVVTMPGASHPWHHHPVSPASMSMGRVPSTWPTMGLKHHCCWPLPHCFLICRWNTLLGKLHAKKWLVYL